MDHCELTNCDDDSYGWKYGSSFRDNLTNALFPDCGYEACWGIIDAKMSCCVAIGFGNGNEETQREWLGIKAKKSRKTNR